MEVFDADIKKDEGRAVLTGAGRFAAAFALPVKIEPTAVIAFGMAGRKQKKSAPGGNRRKFIMGNGDPGRECLRGKSL